MPLLYGTPFCVNVPVKLIFLPWIFSWNTALLVNVFSPDIFSFPVFITAPALFTLLASVTFAPVSIPSNLVLSASVIILPLPASVTSDKSVTLLVVYIPLTTVCAVVAVAAFPEISPCITLLNVFVPVIVWSSVIVTSPPRMFDIFCLKSLDNLLSVISLSLICLVSIWLSLICFPSIIFLLSASNNFFKKSIHTCVKHIVWLAICSIFIWEFPIFLSFIVPSLIYSPDIIPLFVSLTCTGNNFVNILLHKCINSIVPSNICFPCTPSFFNLIEPSLFCSKPSVVSTTLPNLALLIALSCIICSLTWTSRTVPLDVSEPSNRLAVLIFCIL